MAALRAAQSRTRLRRSDPRVQLATQELEGDKPNGISEDDDEDEEPPQKRLRTSRKSSVRSRWVPGGRGGGGRRLDNEGTGTQPTSPVAVTEEIVKPRSRRRDRSTRMTASRSSARPRNRGNTRPRYSTAAAASAAAAHGDGYKPREERGWEEFHPDLDLEAAFAVVSSAEVDGFVKTQPPVQSEMLLTEGSVGEDLITVQNTQRRRPGRPYRTRDSMLQSLLTPEQPKLIPRPGPNPRERLTLPKPSYRILDPFVSYELKDVAADNYVNSTMANVGFQESEQYIRPERTFIRQTEGSAEEDLDLSPDLIVAGSNSAIGGTGVGRVEYDMDEQDVKWLDNFNKTRVDDGVAAIKPAIFEITMTKIEKEWHALEKRIPKPHPKAPQTQRPRSSSAAAVNGEPGPGEEPDSKCAICDDGDCENANAIVFCDGCDLAVHQECYGVPYIPEGQWLCRKCQLVGNARPSCIFCPNEGGAFKQSNNSKWAHLLCANWIPEVSIGNPSLMEPITDVEKVPSSRWKLNCYICRQNMGACIQCSDGRCYEAFHLTCARQAGVYLKMKIAGGQNTLMDKAQLRAYCHRHTPTEWKVEHNTEKSFEHAVKYFRAHFQGQIWADSRASALAISVPEAPQTTMKMTLTNRKGQKPKTIWRLPSGAPVVPEVILKSIEEALMRFTVSKKKEYVAEVCKYWTLKREARRGAALLKRLQLQMDTFSSFEVTRRDYKAQGAAGRARLERRIEFAENLAKDLDRIREIVTLIRDRESEKLKEAALLRDIVDTVYFPVSALLSPMLDRAIKLDPKRIYFEKLTTLQLRVSDRYYNSVSAFSQAFARVFSEDLGFDAAKQENLSALYSRPSIIGDVEQRERRTLARRIVKAVQPILEDALQKESELNGRPYAQQVKEMDDMFSRRHSIVDGIDTSAGDTPMQLENDDTSNGVQHEKDTIADITISSVENVEVEDTTMTDLPEQLQETIKEPGLELAVRSAASNSANTPPASTNGIKYENVGLEQETTAVPNGLEPPTPPMSMRDQGNPHGDRNGAAESSQDVFDASMTEGGIPWYVEAFDPSGTTIWEERWMGQDVLRDMSEELSEMDDDELQDLDMDLSEMDEIQKDTLDVLVNGVKPDADAPNTKKAAVKKNGKKKRKGGNRWNDRNFRIRR